jgi:hypothetical protein
MSLQLHQPDGRGGLEKRTDRQADWRDELRSPRWGSQLGLRKRMPGLANTEMNPTSSVRSVVFWVALAGLTFVVLIAGYGTGFWK